MTPKNKKKEMQKIFAYSFLYLECLDNLKPTSPKVVKFKEDIIGFLEAMGEELKSTETVQKGVYFQELSHKIDTLVRRSFEDN